MKMTRLLFLALLAGCVQEGGYGAPGGGLMGGLVQVQAGQPAGGMFVAAPRPSGGGAFGMAAAPAPQDAPAPQIAATPQALFGAAARGDVAAIDVLLGQGLSANARNPNGATPLQLAAAGGYLQAVQTLLANGADVNAADNAGTTAFAAATLGGYADVARTLKAAGARDAGAAPAPSGAAPQWWQK